MKLVFENEYGVFYDLNDEIQGTMLCYWKGFFQLSNQNTMSALIFSLSYVKENAIKILISEHSELEVMSQDVLDYVNEVWYKDIVENGLQVEVYIDSAELTGSLALEEMYETVENKYKQLLTPKVENIEEAKEVAKKLSEKIYHLK